MSEGELKKRLFDKRDSTCFECAIQAGYEEHEESYKPKICKTKRELTREEQIAVLDEAKKEFPTEENTPLVRSSEFSILKQLNQKREQWFKKWFGGVEAEK